MALLETLTLSKALDMNPEIIIVGVQPEDVSYNLRLTGLIESRIPIIVDTIKELL